MRDVVGGFSFLFIPNNPSPEVLGHSLLGGCGLTERWGRESGGWSWRVRAGAQPRTVTSYYNLWHSTIRDE